jgi:hypothetical protein
MSTKDQSFYVKQGRYIDFGFEPCANAFFDFYVNPKYIDPPLLDIQDVGFFLFLRKNVNPKSPSWKMPSTRQMQRRLGVGWGRLDAIMKRLEHAGLLQKESGIGQGDKGENISNTYLLSDPLPTLEEFLIAFKDQLKEQWREYLVTNYPDSKTESPPDSKTESPVRETESPAVSISESHKQTSYKQTEWDDLWNSVLETLKHQMLATTFRSYLENTQLIDLCDGVATIMLSDPRSRDWIENRMARQLKQLLTIEGKEEVLELRVVERSP